MNRRILILTLSIVALIVFLACNGTATLQPGPTATAQPVTPQAAALAQPTASSLAQPTSTKVNILYVSADGDGVYVRSKPDLEARVTAWPDGTEMIVLDQEGDWYKVQAPDGYIGYVPAKYLVLIRPPAPTIPPRPVVVPTLAPSPTSVPPRPVVVPTLAPSPTSVIAQPQPTSTPAPQRVCPSGVTFICCDGTYSKAQHSQGACSSHKGICYRCP